MNFCHLHLHTEISLLDGYGSVNKYIAKAKELGQNYNGCTDHGSIDNLLQWQIECDKQGVNPVLGAELYIVPDKNIKAPGEKRGHITIWVKNQSGWKTLCSLLTIANIQGFYYKPRIDYNTLLAHDLSGLIIATACAGSFLLLPDSKNLLIQLQKKTQVYFEIMPHDIPAQKKIHNKIKELSIKFSDIQFVATNDCHYINEEEWEAQEVLLAIQSRSKWDDPKRWSFGFKGLHLRTADEMIKAFKKQGDFTEDIYIQAMKNSVKIARQCMGFRIPKQEISLPLPPRFEGQNEIKLLEDICSQGYKDIFGIDNWSQEYIKRYDKEINLLKKKGFIRYFLIVYDLIEWAKQNNIFVGPGRGSVSGSVIAYLMGITQVCPVKFQLSFSRFINDARHELPDIDIDFEKRFRGKVVKYLGDTYGKNYTCGISTVGKMQSKAAIRDVSRVFDIPLQEVGVFAKSIYPSKNDDSDVQYSINNTREGKYFNKKYPNVMKLILKLEGQAKFAGAHAAAVVISSEDLTDTDKCVLIKRKDKIVCNWSMADSEYVGLMKLDILGLSTLSVLAESQRLINDDSFDFNKIPLGNKKTFKLINDGHTSGLFQISGKVCSDLCVHMKVHSFEDIVAAISLARPGPMDSGATEEFVKRKHGAKWEELHPIYEEITKDTYGICIFQEQVMKVISKIAGLSESIADKIRKVIGKKRDVKEFLPFKKMFMEGCKKMGTFSHKESENFWIELGKHANYSFNRSHAVAYALIGYWTAHLKSNYPEAFYAASLTHNEWNEASYDPNKKKNTLLNEIRKAGYEVIPPKRKYSDTINWVFHNKNLYVPFLELNGIGESGANKCLKSVKKTKTQGFFGNDFSSSKINKTKLDFLLEEMEVDNNEIPSRRILKKYLPNIKF